MSAQQRGMAYFDAGRCEICGVELRKRPGTAGRPARFCSGTCRQRARRRRMAAEKVTATRALAARPPAAGEAAVRHGPATPPRDGSRADPAGGTGARGGGLDGPAPPPTATARAEGSGADGRDPLPPQAPAEPPPPGPAAAAPAAADLPAGHLADPIPAAGAAPVPSPRLGGHGTAAGPGETAPAPDAGRYPQPTTPDPTGVPAPPVGLPAPLDAFVGREEEIAELKALLSAARLITLVGPAGTGKTRLALELAARVASGHDGVWLAELSGLADDRLLAHRVAESLGIDPAADASAERALAARLRAGRTLLILDTCEHVVDAAARLAVTLLRACPGLTVLATSRRPLDAPGEHLFPVRGLSLPAHRAPRSRGELLRSDAVRLFVERVRAVSPGFELTRENGDEIAEICVRLDGNPLALELAARVARLRPVGHILDRLDDRLHLLSHGARTAEPRHRDLRTAIAWSYELLGPDEQRLFRRLSVLAGWFTADDARQVCGDPGLTADAALHLLGRLESSSLLVTEHGRPGGRFRMTESIRLYARERLAAAGEEDDAHERLITWLLEVAAPVVGDGRLLRSARDLDPLAAAHHTLRHAVDRAIGHGDDRGLLLATALAHGLWHLGRLGEARRVLGAALARTGAGAPGRAAALGCAAVLAVLDGDGAQALDLATRALDLARGPIPRARALLAVQTVRRCLGDLAGADEAARACLDALGESTVPGDRAAVLHERARLAVRGGDLDGARDLLDRCHAARLGPPSGEAEPVPPEWAHTAATVALLGGDTDAAARRWRDLLGAYRPPGGEAPLLLECVAGLAVVAARAGDALRAVRLAAAAGLFRDGPLLRGGTIPGEVLTEAVTEARAALSSAAASAAIRDGERLGGPDLIGYALGGAWREPGDGESADPVLTDRERQVALLVAEGLANRQIARRLHVSERTVHTHLERIRAKLGLPSRAHIVRWVLEEGGATG